MVSGRYAPLGVATHYRSTVYTFIPPLPIDGLNGKQL